MNELDRYTELTPLVSQKIETDEQYDEYQSLKAKIQEQIDCAIYMEDKNWKQRNQEALELESQVAKLKEECNECDMNNEQLKSTLDEIKTLAEDFKSFEDQQGHNQDYVDSDELKALLPKHEDKK